jgi:hypothetical protein
MSEISSFFMLSAVYKANLSWGRNEIQAGTCQKYCEQNTQRNKSGSFSHFCKIINKTGKVRQT